MVSHCACPTRVFGDRALHEHRRPLTCPLLFSHGLNPMQRDLGKRGLFKSLYLSLEEWPRLPSTARIGRAHFYNAPSKLARCLFRDEG